LIASNALCAKALTVLLKDEFARDLMYDGQELL